ncbi:MAG: glycosyltransferase family 4 protein [Acidimicrobiales bacterium]
MAFVHVTEPGFESGGAELRTRQLFGALHKQWDEASLSLVPGVRRPPWALPRLGASMRGIPPRLTQLYDPAVVRSVNALADGSDLTVASASFTAALLTRAHLKHVVLDAHNLEWRVNSQLAATADGIIRRVAYQATTRWMSHFETSLARSVAGVWAVSAEEATWFERLGICVWVVPNGVDVPSDAQPLPDSHEMLFVGSLNSVFNRHGLEWFFSHVWPALRRNVPDVRMTIVGGGRPLDAPVGIEQLGFVEDLVPIYEKARVCIAPLLGGAGTRLKVLEAMARARPVVATPVGAEGIDVSEAEGVFIRADPVAFADACAALLTDYDAASESGAQGRSRATDFSWDRVASVAAQSLTDLSRT